jgi:hypothetical protein
MWSAARRADVFANIRAAVREDRGLWLDAPCGAPFPSIHVEGEKRSGAPGAFKQHGQSRLPDRLTFSLFDNRTRLTMCARALDRGQ